MLLPASGWSGQAALVPQEHELVKLRKGRFIPELIQPVGVVLATDVDELALVEGDA